MSNEMVKITFQGGTLNGFVGEIPKRIFETYEFFVDDNHEVYFKHKETAVYVFNEEETEKIKERYRRSAVKGWN